MPFDTTAPPPTRDPRRAARVAAIAASITTALADAERPPVTAELAQRTATWIAGWVDLDTAYALATEFGSPVQPDVKGAMIAYWGALGEVGRPDRIADRMRLEAEYRRDSAAYHQPLADEYRDKSNRLTASGRLVEAEEARLTSSGHARCVADALSEAKALEARADQIAARPLAVA